jgi:hypothetical protein
MTANFGLVKSICEDREYAADGTDRLLLAKGKVNAIYRCDSSYSISRNGVD